MKPTVRLSAITTGSCLAVTSLLGSTSEAQAQSIGAFLDSPIPVVSDRGRNISVRERVRPEFAPQGIGVEGFVLYPQVSAGVGVSDNVFNAETNQRSDVFFDVNPEFQLRSRWASHDLRFSSGAQLRRYANESLANQTGIFSRLSGRYDVNRDTNIVANAQFVQAYQPQLSSSVPDNALQPAKYVQLTGSLRGVHKFGRWRSTVAVDANKFDFRDIILTGGTVFDQDFRDRTVIRGAARQEYAFTPDASVFGEVNYSKIDHRLDLIGTRRNRDGNERRFLGGVNFDLSALARAQIGVGYIKRSFAANDIYRPISGLAYDVRLEYFPSGLTTVTLIATKSVEEAVTVSAGGILANNFELSADHELLRNLILSAAASYQTNQFKGLARKDKVFGGRGEATFLFSPQVGIRGGVRYIDRRSTGTQVGQSFNEWQAVATVVLRR